METQRPRYLKQIKERILAEQEKEIFVATDFVDIADKQTVNVALARLEKEGILERVLRGVYHKRRYSDFLGRYVPPNYLEVAEAIAQNNGWTICPYGDAALNILGLSTQVPAVIRYVSSGPYKTYKAGPFDIKFRRTCSRYIADLSYKNALIVHALLALGRDNIDKRSIAHLRDSLTPTEKNALLIQTKRTPCWVYESIKEICRADGQNRESPRKG